MIGPQSEVILPLYQVMDDNEYTLDADDLLQMREYEVIITSSVCLS